MEISKEKLETIVNAAISEMANHTHTEDCQYCKLCKHLREMPTYVNYLNTMLTGLVVLGRVAALNDCFLLGYFVGRSTVEQEVLEKLLPKVEL